MDTQEFKRLCHLLDDPNSRVRLLAIREISRRADPAPAASRIVELLQDPDPEVCKEAVQVLEDEEMDTKIAAEMFISLFKSDSAEQRKAACLPAVQALWRPLPHPDPGHPYHHGSP